MLLRHLLLSIRLTAAIAALSVIVGASRTNGQERQETVGERLRRLQRMEAELARSVRQRTLALLDSEEAVARSALGLLSNVATVATGAPAAGGAAENVIREIAISLGREVGEAQEAKRRGDYDGALASLSRVLKESVPVIVEEYSEEIPDLATALRGVLRGAAQIVTVGEPLVDFAIANKEMLQQYVNLKRTQEQHEKVKADLALFVDDSQIRAPKPKGKTKDQTTPPPPPPPPPPSPPKWSEELDGAIRIMELADLASMNGLESASRQQEELPTELEQQQRSMTETERLLRAAEQEESAERDERAAAARAAVAGQPFDRSLGALNLRALIPPGWVPCQCPPDHPGAGIFVNGVQYHTPLLRCP